MLDIQKMLSTKPCQRGDIAEKASEIKRPEAKEGNMEIDPNGLNFPRYLIIDHKDNSMVHYLIQIIN